MSREKMFHDVATYYDRYRPGLPDAAITYLVARFALGGASRVLDLGCGTGQVARSLCKRVGKVVCVDSDEDMIHSLQISPETRRVCIGKLDVVQSTAEEYAAPAGTFDLVAICRAFHWMNQEVVLAKCKSFLRASGGIALLGDSSLWNGSEPWQKTAKETIQRFLGQERRAGSKKFAASTEPYEAMLRRHGYRDIATKEFAVVRSWNVSSLLGYLYSTSFSARPMFGDRVQEFEDALQEALGDPGKDDTFEERVQFTVQSGRK